MWKQHTASMVILALIILVGLQGEAFGISRLKLNKDDVEIVHPNKVKKPLSLPKGGHKIDTKTVATKKGNVMPERQSALAESNDVESIQKAKISVDSIIKSNIDTLDILTIPSVINAEFVLETGKTYHATTDVLVTAGGILKHRPGAIVKWAANTGLFVDPTGIYISRGFPDQMCINIPDTNSPTAGYWKGIKIAGGDAHTSLSEISYTYVGYAVDGFTLSDVELTKFENNFAENGGTGITVYGPRQTRISNNVCYWNGTGIYASQEDESGTIADPKYVIELINNTCHENVYGIMLIGTSDALVGTTVMERNICTASETYNYSLWSGNLGSYFIPLFADNGRWLKYAGSANSNYDAVSWETNPVEDFTDPFEPGQGYFDIVRLKQTSAFIDASRTRVWDSLQVGFTTSNSGIPDGNIIDLGFHYANWDFSSVGDPNIKCDFDGDTYVGINDLSLLMDFWLMHYINPHGTNGASPDIDSDGRVTFNDFSFLGAEYKKANPNSLCDFDGDGKVDINDLQILSEFWLENPGVLPLLSLDVDNDHLITFKDFSIFGSEWQKHKGSASCPPLNVDITDGTYGEKVFTLTGYDQSIVRLFLFVDGSYVKELFLEPDSLTTSRSVFMGWLESGIHRAKIIAFDTQINLICYPQIEFSISPGISEHLVPTLYGKGKPLPFSASSDISEDVKVAAWSDNAVVWSATFPSGSQIIGNVPASITQQYDLDALQFVPVSVAANMIKTASGGSAGGSFDPTDYPADNYNGFTALMVRPDFVINFTAGLADSQYSILKQRGYNVRKLSFWTSCGFIVKNFAQNSHIEVLCVHAHGNYRIKGQYREVQELTDGYIVSDKVSNYDPYSSAPPWLTSLGLPTEMSIYTWKDMGFNYLNFATFDSCYSCRLRINSSNQLVENTGDQVGYYNDLFMALNLQADSPLLGWSDTFIQNSEFSKFSFNVWDQLGQQNNLWDSIFYATQQAGYEGSRFPPQEFRMYGYGIVYEFRL